MHFHKILLSISLACFSLLVLPVAAAETEETSEESKPEEPVAVAVAEEPSVEKSAEVPVAEAAPEKGEQEEPAPARAEESESELVFCTFY